MLQVILDWRRQPFYSFRIHGQEIGQRRHLRSRQLSEFRLRRRDKFLYTYSFIDLWEWEVRVLDIEPIDPGTEDEWRPRCVQGRAAAPPEDAGGPRGYMRILDQQRYYLPIAEPELAQKAFERMAAALPDQEARDLLKMTLDKGLERAAQRLTEYAQLDPGRFSLQEANERLKRLPLHGRAHR